MQKGAVFINIGLISENKVTNEKFKQKIQSSSKESEKVSKKFQLTDTSEAVHSLATCVPSEAALPRPLPHHAIPCVMFHVSYHAPFPVHIVLIFHILPSLISCINVSLIML